MDRMTEEEFNHIAKYADDPWAKKCIKEIRASWKEIADLKAKVSRVGSLYDKTYSDFHAENLRLQMLVDDTATLIPDLDKEIATLQAENEKWKTLHEPAYRKHAKALMETNAKLKAQVEAWGTEDATLKVIIERIYQCSNQERVIKIARDAINTWSEL